MPNIIMENPKATVTIIVTMIWVIIAYLLNAIWQITLPAEVVVAVTTLLGLLIGHWTRINKQDAKVLDVMPQAQKDLIVPPKEEIT